MERILILLISLLIPFSSRAQVPETAPSTTDTMILIMVDGARPDNINYLVEKGRMPNVKKYFYQEGTVFNNSFTTLSLTVPSWSSILTGRDIDRTAIKGNDIFDRESKHIENFLDWRRDILFDEFRDHGRAYRILRGGGHKTILDYFQRPNKTDFSGLVVDNYGDDSEIFATFFPLNDKFPLYMFGTVINNLLQLDTAKQTTAQNALIRLLFEKKDFFAIDRDGVEQTLKVINAPYGKKKKLILLYFSSVDHYSHLEHGKGMEALELVDSEIGRIIRAINRSRYRDSTIALISDHGSQGGHEYNHLDSHHPLKGLSYALTATNLSYLLTGWYNFPGYDQYSFNTASTFAAEGKFSLRNWKEFQLQPFECTNEAKILNIPYLTCGMEHKNHPEQVQAGVSTSQTISLPKSSVSSNIWNVSNNWHDLTHYIVQKTSSGGLIFHNIISDLERFELPNVKSYSPESEALISKHPMDWLAVSISKEDFNKSLSPADQSLQSENDILVIHHSDNSQALILYREGADGRREYKYVPVKFFDQSSDGKVSFVYNAVNGSDPFRYLTNDFVDRSLSGKFVDDKTWLDGYHTDREWAERYAATDFPNAVSAVYKTFFFNRESKSLAPGQRFDILLNPNYGHIFTVENDDLEAQHGMFQRESVRNTFMLRGPRVKSAYQYGKPVFSVDVLPTLFEAVNKMSSEQLKSLDLDGSAIEGALR